MGTDPHAAGTDTGVFAPPLRAYERGLFRGIVLSRVAILLALGLILPVEPSWHGDGLFVVIAIAWVATLIWVILPLRSIGRLFDTVAARPGLVWIDVGVSALLLVVGGGWENLFYLYAWSPFGFASVFWSARRTVLLAAGGCGVLVVSFTAWHAGGWDPAARHVGISAWVAPLAGYVVVGGLFGYVRRRFDDLADAAAAYGERASEAITAAQAAAAAAEREEVAYRLHRRLCQIFPALALRVAALAGEVRGDEAAVSDLAGLALVTAHVDATLDDVLARLRVDEMEGTGRAGTFDTGRDPPSFVG
jgi:hypothetical protein